MRTPDIGHDAPWIEDAERNGFGGTETPYDKANENDLLKAADDEFGWKILALFLGIAEDDMPCDEQTLQALWLSIIRMARELHIKWYRKHREANLREWYNEWHDRH